MVRIWRRDTPADDHPAVGIDDEADVGHAGPGRDERQIGDPQLIGRGRGEVPAHQIGMARGGGVRFGGADPFAAPHTGDPGSPHEPGDLVPAEVVAGTAGGFPQLARPVDAVVVLPQLHQGRTHDGVTLRPLLTDLVSWPRNRCSGPPAPLPSDRTVQMGSTPNSSRLASMKSTISCVGGRAPPRRNWPLVLESRWRA